MSENQQHTPCPFCGGTDLMVTLTRGVQYGSRIHCPGNSDPNAAPCFAYGPERMSGVESQAIAAAWEAWDAAGKREGSR